MKRFYTVFLLAFSLLTFGCNNAGDNSANTGADSSKVITAPVDNANATNPSAADTTYPKKDTMVTKGDSLRKGK